MGLQSHIEFVLAKGRFKPSGIIKTNVTTRPPQMRFQYTKDRDKASSILKGSGEFNPYKVGKYVIRFSDMPMWGGKRR